MTVIVASAVCGLLGCSPSSETSKEPVLTYLYREGKAVANKKPPLLILMHGVGSNEHDLYALKDYLPEEYLVVFARAPFELGPNSYKWYDVDFSTGKPVINEEEAEQSRKMIDQFIEQLKSKHEFDTSKVILGGFSQGAIMSYSVGMQSDKVSGVVALSGRMLDDTKRYIGDTDGKLPQTLIIHGTQDGVLPLAYAQTASELLRQENVKLSYHELTIGHQINSDVLQILNQWLLNFE